MSTRQMTRRVFISHSHKDKELVRDIARRMRAAGLEPIVELDATGTGDWKSALRDAIRDADAVLFLVTPATLDWPWAMTELGMAEGFDKVIVPVVAGLELKRLPAPLRTYRAIPFDQLDKAIRNLGQESSEAEAD